MHTSSFLLLLLLLLLLLSSSQASMAPPGRCPSCFSSPTLSQSSDFGMILHSPPSSVFSPRSPGDLSLLLAAIANSSAYDMLTLGPNGNRHSTFGQALVPRGIVVEMRTFPRSIRVDAGRRFVEADGGALWSEVLRETLRFGLSPRSWTDYLNLTVGGTLSVGGISGQTFKHGPQITNVLEMDVITGTGKMVTCSMKANQDLFLGVLGGSGQFGIITRARIALQAAFQMAKWVKIPYDDFDTFTRDMELLIGNGQPDYVEGQILAPNASSVSYEIELALYYNKGDDIDMKLKGILSRLSSRRGKESASEVSYFDFLNRVAKEEAALREIGLWEVPHPWLSIFFPRSGLGLFKDAILGTIASKPINGPFLLYPFYASKWDRRMSTVIPRDGKGENILYVVSILRSAAASCTPDSQCIKELLELNEKITAKSIGEGGAKLYLAPWKGEEEWSAHFGEKWEGLKCLKAKYDPLHILAPGLQMFRRISLSH